jgi:anaerobic magnesium-protoporphyrin IX monomethyl ester cyclase
VAFGRVLLIQPEYPGSHYYRYRKSLTAGIGYVSETLSRADIPNTVVDLNLGHNWVHLQQRIGEFQPDLIGMGMMSFRYDHSYALLEKIKQSFPNIAIVVGGPHLSTVRQRVLEECAAIDYGITLEAEETIVELCCAESSISDVRGVLYRDSGGQVHYTRDRPCIRDLDKTGFPTYARFETDKYTKERRIVTSRGCPYNCIFCPVQLAIGRQWRFRSAESVAEEFEYWYARGIRRFGIVDDNFTLRRERVLKICDELERRRLVGLKIDCSNGIRADRVDRDLLTRMKEVGFFDLAFGVEAGTDRVLERIGKGEKIETIERAIKDACELGYRVRLFFMIGLPEQTRADVEESVKLALKYPIYEAPFYNIILFPGTDLFDWVTQNGYFCRGKDYLKDASHWVNEPVFETPELSREERKRLYKWANEVARLHALPQQREVHWPDFVDMFERMGFPLWIARLGASVYWSRVFQKHFTEARLVKRLKRRMSG